MRKRWEKMRKKWIYKRGFKPMLPMLLSHKEKKCYPSGQLDEH